MLDFLRKAFNGFFLTRREALIQCVLIVLCIIALNYLFNGIMMRFDLTEDSRYTISQPSRDIARSIVEPITITIYFSKDVNPSLTLFKEEFQSYLDEFRVYSDYNIEYQFINPNESEELELEAQQVGISPFLVDVRERDQITQRRTYMGAVLNYEDRTEIIPLLRPDASLEYVIASSIKKLLNTSKQVVGILQGHDEPKLENMYQLVGQLREHYDVRTVEDIDTTGIPADIDVLLIIAPKQKLSEQALVAIDQYFMSGGKLSIALDRFNINNQTAQAIVLSTGIEEMLANYGIGINADLLRDNQSSNIQVQQRQGNFIRINTVKYPFIIQVTNFAEHPITEGLEIGIYPYISSVNTNAVDSLSTVTLLATTSDQSARDVGYVSVNPFRNWNETSFDESYIPFAAAIKGVFKSAYLNNETVNVDLDNSLETSIVVFGGGSFLNNGEGNQSQELPPDNINFMVNAIDWLVDDTGLIRLRTKGVTNRPIEQLDDTTKDILKYTNVFFPILIVVVIGIFIRQRNKNKRIKWMQKGI